MTLLLDIIVGAATPAKRSIKADYVPYELSLKLYKLGFDFDTMGKWVSNGPSKGRFIHPANEHLMTIGEKVVLIKAPMWQQAFDWFREKHSLYGDVLWQRDFLSWCYKIDDLKLCSTIGEKDYGTYDEARQDCLKQLIKIAKEKKS